MRTLHFRSHLFLLLFFVFGFTATANDPITMAEKKAVIDSVSELLESIYVFPEKATEMAALLKENYRKGKYEDIAHPDEFAEALTKDLYSVSQDGHIRVMFNPKAIAKENQAEENKENPDRAIAERLKLDNYGFHEVSVLEGNVGYVNLSLFYDPKYAGETAVAAMNFLSNTDAIIFDLRYNRGGSPKMIQLLQSYLFDEEPVHLNNFYFRPNDETTQSWTLPFVQGKRNPDADVYVLTSNRTFSAGEEFSYNLKNLERATLVGETTGGGAHPGGIKNATDRFSIFIPSGRAINPITNTNWEGLGVNPHIKVDEDKALVTAHSMALKNLLKTAEEDTSKDYYLWHLKAVQAEANPLSLNMETLESYVGTYGDREIVVEDKGLFFERGREKFELVPLGNDEFLLPKMPFMRIGFSEDKRELREMYDMGRQVIHSRE